MCVFKCIIACLIWLAVFKSSSIYITASVFIPLCSNNLSCFKIRCRTTLQLWRPRMALSWLRVCCARPLPLLWNCRAVLKLLVSEWNVDTHIWADCILLCVCFSHVRVLLVEGRREGSWMCAQLIQCFVKWPRSCVWLLRARLWLSLGCSHLLNEHGLSFKSKYLCDRLNFQDIRAIILY